MEPYGTLISTDGALDAAKILNFINSYPTVLRSVDDFVSKVPDTEGKLGRNIQVASGSMCADEVNQSKPRGIINSGDVVFAYFPPGGKCSNHLELIKINGLEKFDEESVPAEHNL